MRLTETDCLTIKDRSEFMTSHLAKLALALVIAAPAAAQDFSLSVYGGVQTLPHSVVTGNDPAGVGPFSFTAGWDGNSFDAPPYYGVRGTWWRDDHVGFSLDFTHSKAYADSDTLTSTGFSVLEFTDGINTVTVNALRRFPNAGRWTPYVGGGVGIAVPHVEVQTTGGAPRTFEYQYGGVAAQLQGGVEYQINESWTVFGEYKMNYVDLDVDLDGGGSLSTDLITNAFNIGAGFSF